MIYPSASVSTSLNERSMDRIWSLIVVVSDPTWAEQIGQENASYSVKRHWGWWDFWVQNVGIRKGTRIVRSLFISAPNLALFRV